MTDLGVVVPVGGAVAGPPGEVPPAVVLVQISTTTVPVDESDDGLVVVQIDDQTIEVSQEG